MRDFRNLTLGIVLLICFGAGSLASAETKSAQSKNGSKKSAKTFSKSSSKTARAPKRVARLSAPRESWQSLARKVGQSEDFRASAIRDLKRLPHLSGDLRQALRTSDRPLALEVISALEIRSLIPDMIALVPQDPDGFMVLGVNALMTSQTRDSILNLYLDNLQPKTLNAVSTGAIIAMLEPLGRLGVELSGATFTAISRHRSPDVRGSLLYYVRMMALRHDNLIYADYANDLTSAAEYQLRLQAISTSAEIAAINGSRRRTAHLKDRSDLTKLCGRETEERLREACLSFLGSNVAGGR